MLSRTGDAGPKLLFHIDSLFANVHQDDAEASFARHDLATSLYECIARLCDLALGKDDEIAKRWAGETLACVFVSLQKRHQKLRPANSSYRQKEAKMRKQLRSDVLFPSKPGPRALQEELKRAERYWRQLTVLRALAHKRELGRSTWQETAILLKIPEEYWPLAELLAFSEKSERDWWKKILWPRIKKKQSKLLPSLRRTGKLRAEAKTGKLSLRTFQHQIRRHSQKLAALRDAGIF